MSRKFLYISATSASGSEARFVEYLSKTSASKRLARRMMRISLRDVTKVSRSTCSSSGSSSPAPASLSRMLSARSWSSSRLSFIASTFEPPRRSLASRGAMFWSTLSGVTAVDWMRRSAPDPTSASSCLFRESSSLRSVIMILSVLADELIGSADIHISRMGCVHTSRDAIKVPGSR